MKRTLSLSFAFGVSLLLLATAPAGAQAPDETPEEVSEERTEERTEERSEEAARGEVAPAPPMPAALASARAPRPTHLLGDLPEPAVIEVRAAGSGLSEAAIGDRIVVRVRSFGSLWRQAEERCDRIGLFLDDVPMEGLLAESCTPPSRDEAAIGTVGFSLRTTDRSREAWRELLRRPRQLRREVGVSVGVGRLQIRSEVDDFTLVIAAPWRSLSAGLFFLVVLIAFMWMAQRTDILRNAHFKLPPRRGGQRVGRSYSLSRFQMAFWWFLVSASYVFIWIITGELESLNESVLVLLGIGAGTAVGASLIDADRQRRLEDQRMSLRTRLRRRRSGSGEEGRSLDVVGIEEELARIERARSSRSRGFLHDILSGPVGGIALQRFQMLVWTAILGFVFVYTVYQELSMPELNGTLLVLMGISSGGYLGFKFPEQQFPLLNGGGSSEARAEAEGSPEGSPEESPEEE